MVNMNSKSRIASILKSNTLDCLITDIGTFRLSELNISSDLEFELPTNLRLGHLVEKITSELIKFSSTFEVLHENVQVIEDKKTIGEIDFILKNVDSHEVIHMELAYKFYLFDPSISSEPVNNWIGPNRNDSLKEKLEKLKQKQFPLLRHPCTQAKIKDIKVENVSQKLCLLMSLFVPLEFKGILSPSYKNAVKGYYLNFDKFASLHNDGKTYYIPSKKEWGIDPSVNENWAEFENVKKNIIISISEKQAPLIWQKNKNTYSVFFVIWW